MPAKHDPHSNIFVNYDAKETPIEQLFSKEIEKKTETDIIMMYILVHLNYKLFTYTCNILVHYMYM